MPYVPKGGTIVPKMSTMLDYEILSETLFGKTRRAVLSLLYGHPDEAFYLRQLIRVAGVGLGTVQREVRRLSEAGIIRRMVRVGRCFIRPIPSARSMRNSTSAAISLGLGVRHEMTYVTPILHSSYILPERVAPQRHGKPLLHHRLVAGGASSVKIVMQS